MSWEAHGTRIVISIQRGSVDATQRMLSRKGGGEVVVGVMSRIPYPWRDTDTYSLDHLDIRNII